MISSSTTNSRQDAKKKATTIVLGASGATGQRLVGLLLKQGQHVKAVVRSPDSLPPALKENPGLTIIQASLLDLGDTEIAGHLQGCDSVASCLGHTLSLRGIFGQPRRLVTETTRRLCEAIKENNAEKPVKFVLMNTAGNQNRDLEEPISFAQKCVIALLWNQWKGQMPVVYNRVPIP